MTDKQILARADINYNLLSYISHEIRGPFNGLIGFSELLRSHSFDLPEKRKEEYATLIHQLAVKSYLQLQTFIAWVKIISNNIAINKGATPFSDLINQSLAFVENDAESRNINMIVTPDSSSLVIDTGLFSVAIANILFMCMRSGKEKQEIRITFQPEQQTMSVQFKHQQELQSVFEQIEHVSNQEPSEQNFRLWVASNIIKLHGGSLSVESQNNKLKIVRIGFPENA